MSRGLKIMFGLSLALNLLFVGLAGGAWYKFKKFAHHGGGSRYVYVASRLIQDLPEPRRKALMADFRAGQAQHKQSRQARKDSWKKVMDSVATEPFDGDTVRASLAAMHRLRFDKRKTVGEKFIAMMEKMTPEERVLMRDSRMFKKMMRWGKHRHRHNGGRH